MITSQLTREMGKLDQEFMFISFRAAVYYSRLLSLYAIYATRAGSFLSRRRPSSVPGLTTSIEEWGLCLAAERGSNAVIQCLFEHGVSADATDEEGVGALHASVAQGNEESARLLLDNEADVNVIRIAGSPLHYAVSARKAKTRLSMMRLLFQYGANVSVRDRDNETVLYRAAYRGDALIVDLLLDHGAPIEQRQGGMTALMIASRQRRAETTRSLLRRGGDFNSVSTATGHDCLCLAVIGDGSPNSIRDLTWTIKSLIRHGADIDGSTQKTPPLSLGILRDSELQFETVELLLNAGADIEKADFMGHTPLEIWISKSDWTGLHVFDLLLKRNANVNKLDNERRSPLSQACAATGDHSVEPRVHVIEKLIEYEADLNHTDDNGDTPAMIICMNSALSGQDKYLLLQVLLNSGTNVRLKNRRGEMLLHKVMRNFERETKDRKNALKLVLDVHNRS